MDRRDQGNRDRDRDRDSYSSSRGAYSNSRDRDHHSRDRDRDHHRDNPYSRDRDRERELPKTYHRNPPRDERRDNDDRAPQRGENSERDFDRARDNRADLHQSQNRSAANHDSLLKDPVASQDSDKSPDTIYISGLPKTVNDDSLARFFGTVGTIKIDKKTGNPKVWIYKDKSTGLPKGDATVTFEDPSASDGAISWFDGKMFEGKNAIKVEKAQAIKPPPGGWNARRGGRGGGRGRW